MKTPYLRRPADPGQQYRRWVDPRLARLRLAAVVAYLRERGWRELPPDRMGLLAFQEPTGAVVDGRAVCQFVPESEAYADYTARMFELVTGLAEFEDRQAADVLDDITRSATDESPNGAGHGLSGESRVVRPS